MRNRSIGRFAIIILTAVAIAIGASYLLAYHTWLFPIATAGTGFAAMMYSLDWNIWLRPKAEEPNEHQGSMLATGQRSAATGRDQRRVGLVTRWGVAVAVSVAGSALSWWGCLKLLHLDEGVSLGVAGAVLAMLMAPAGWWASQAADNEEADNLDQIVQRRLGSRGAHTAAHDQTISRSRRDE